MNYSVPCPICNKSYLVRDIEQHVNNCLDATARDAQIKNDEDLALQLNNKLNLENNHTSNTVSPPTQQSVPNVAHSTPQVYSNPPNNSPYTPPHQPTSYHQVSYHNQSPQMNYYPPSPYQHIQYQVPPVHYNSSNSPLIDRNRAYSAPVVLQNYAYNSVAYPGYHSPSHVSPNGNHVAMPTYIIHPNGTTQVPYAYHPQPPSHQNAYPSPPIYGHPSPPVQYVYQYPQSPMTPTMHNLNAESSPNISASRSSPSILHNERNVQLERNGTENNRNKRNSLPDIGPVPTDPIESTGFLLRSMLPLKSNHLNLVFSDGTPEDRSKVMDETWLAQLKQNPDNEPMLKALITGHLNVILTTDNHRFGKLLGKFIDSWNRKHTSKSRFGKRRSLTDSQISSAIDEIKDFITNLLSALDSFYGGLFEINSAVKHYCQLVIDDLLFPRIYKDLFEMYKRKYRDQDSTHANKIKELLTVNLAHLGVTETFWLLPNSNTLEAMEALPPYFKAITTLQKIVTMDTPSKKIECLVQTANAIISCVQDHWKKEIIIGGDELLPLFAYVVIRSSINHMCSEAAFIETFISDKAAIEKGGYLLATFQTCLQFLTRLDSNEMQKNSGDILERIKKEKEVTDKRVVKQDSATKLTLENLEKMFNEDFEELSTSAGKASPEHQNLALEPVRDYVSTSVDLIEL